jgi:hypothetical protein
MAPTIHTPYRIARFASGDPVATMHALGALIDRKAFVQGLPERT